MDSSNKYLNLLNQRLRKGFSAHTTSDGRIFYLNHITKTSSWLPPIDNWEPGDDNLPFGWEYAKDLEANLYFLNHINKTSTYEDPRKDFDESPPEPREVELHRDPPLHGGFGFVVGSEKPAIIRSVEPNGPCANLLIPGDEILKVNGHDVSKARNREIVDMVRSCENTVRLTVIQPSVHNYNSARKSAILTAAKKAKLKSHPSRVRFAEGVAVNGSPFLGSTPFDSCAQFLPNMLKVYLENGQTKTFKYDATITVQDVLLSLQEKLSIRCLEYYALCTELVRPNRRRKLTLLDPKDNLAKIAARPGAHNLRCLFRICFVPKDISTLFSRDPLSFDYFYAQCCNDVIQERLTPEIPYEIALRLCALHIYELALSYGLVNSRGKVKLKAFDKEFGLENFVPYSLLDSIKRKDLHKYINSASKYNRQNLTPPPGQKFASAAQAKLQFISIISELSGYGAKVFTYNLRDCLTESGLLVLISPRYGIGHINRNRPGAPVTLAKIEDVLSVKIIKEDESIYIVEINMKSSGNSLESSPLHFCLDEKDTEEFVLVLNGYHKVFTGDLEKEIPVSRKVEPSWWTDTAPSYYGEHLVKVAPWSYIPSSESDEMKRMNLSLPPPRYMAGDIIPTLQSDNRRSLVDHNMNSSDGSLSGINDVYIDNGVDFSSLVSMEMFSSVATDNGLRDDANLNEEDAIRRVMEMSKIVADAEYYLRQKITAKKVDSKKEYTTDESNCGDFDDSHENFDQPKLKAADSLLLLTQLDNREFEGTKISSTSIDDTSPCESDTDVESLIISSSSPIHELQSTSSLYSEQLKSHTNPSNNKYYSHSEDNSNLANRHKVTIPISSSSHVNSSNSSFDMNISPSKLSDVENDLLETLKSLKNPGEYQSLDSDENIYHINHDIIDLTTIPPLKLSSSLSLMQEEEESPYAISSISHPASSSSSLYANPASTSKLYESFHHHQPDMIDNDLSLDNLRLNTSIIHPLNDTSNSISINTLKSLPDNIDIDKYIATLTVPPPPTSSLPLNTKELSNSSDYLDSLIIPPPPIASPGSTIEQDEIIARFWKATDDMRKVCNEREDSSPQLSSRGLYSSSSADSGYDSIIHSSNLIINKSNEYCSASHHHPNYHQVGGGGGGGKGGGGDGGGTSSVDYGQHPNNFLPTVRESPMDNLSKNIYMPQSINTQSIQNCFKSNHHHQPISSELVSLGANIGFAKKMNSCDNLYILSRKQDNKTQHDRQYHSLRVKDRGSKSKRSLTKSHSWTSLGARCSSPLGKPPLPPNSNTRKDQRRSSAATESSILTGKKKRNELIGSKYYTFNESNNQLNTDKLDKWTVNSIIRTDLSEYALPDYNNLISLPVQTSSVNSLEMDNFLGNSGKIEDIFVQSQRDIDTLLVRLEEVHETRLAQQGYNRCDIDKYNNAKESLVIESRCFVTASKLFVKWATEASAMMFEYLLECVALLERMFIIGEELMNHLESQAHITCLVDRLKEVAATYGYTVDTVQRLTDGIKSSEEASLSPYMGLLMNHATSLATSLSALMRTLRALN